MIMDTTETNTTTLVNSSMATNMTMSSTTSTTTSSTTEMTTISFDDVPGLLYNFHEMTIMDWDEMSDIQNDLTLPRAYTSWNALNIIRLTLATWIIASHIALMVFVIGKRQLRTQAKNWCIINVALANMLMGCFVVPVKLHFTLNPDLVNCDLSLGWTFIAEYYQTSVSLFAVFCLVFERFIYVFSEKKQKLIRPFIIAIGAVVLFILPWALSLILLLPTFFGGLIAKSPVPGTCLYKVDDSYFLACQLLAFIPAALGVFVLAPFTGLLDCLRPKSCIYRPLTPKGESLTITAVVSFFSIFSEVPYCIVRVLMMRMECNSAYCSRFAEGLNLTMWFRIIKAAIFPFIWLAYSDIREAMRCNECHWEWEENSDDELDELNEQDERL